MTIRSGGRPRDRRATQARPYDPDAYATETIPEFSEAVPRGRRGSGRGGPGGSFVGFLKFLVFAVILAIVVLAVVFTALRPVVSDAIMGIADDNPAALQLPFVKDIVAERLGPASDDTGLDRSDAGRIPRGGGRYGADDRHQARDAGPDRRQPRVRLHLGRPQPDRLTPAGDLHPAQEHDPRPARERAARPAGGALRGYRAAHGPAHRADHGEARDAPAPDGRVASSTRSSSRRQPSSLPTIRGSRRSSPTPRRAPRSRASCGRRRTASCPTRRPRNSSGSCSTSSP